MTAEIIDGKRIAEEMLSDLKEKVALMKDKPGLALVLVGNDPASQIYVTNKKKKCDELGIYCERYNFEENISEKELEELIIKLNNDKKIDGILVQLPLPKHINESIIEKILPEKDVDGLTLKNQDRIKYLEPPIEPATPRGIIRLINSTKVGLEGKHVVIIGRSKIVGISVALMLVQKNATVTFCHSKTNEERLKDLTKMADILIVAVGKPKIITKDMVKQGAVVIDVGINRVDGKIVGDVDFENVKEVASFITPVPGGVGPMTIAMLLDQLILLRSRKLRGEPLFKPIN